MAEQHGHLSTDNVLVRVAREKPQVIVTLLLLVFVGLVVWEVRPSNAAMIRQHEEIRAEMAAIEQKHSLADLRMEQLMGEVRDAMQRSAYLEFRNCLNTARNAGAMDKCIYKD